MLKCYLIFDDFKLNFASGGVRTHLKNLFNVFGSILIDSQPKPIHGDPFQIPNYNFQSLGAFPQGLFFPGKRGSGDKKSEISEKYKV